MTLNQEMHPLAMITYILLIGILSKGRSITEMLHGGKDSREIHALRFFSTNIRLTIVREHLVQGKYGKWKNTPMRGDRVEGKRSRIGDEIFESSSTSQEPLHSFPQTMN